MGFGVHWLIRLAGCETRSSSSLNELSQIPPPVQWAKASKTKRTDERCIGVFADRKLHPKCDQLSDPIPQLCFSTRPPAALTPLRPPCQSLCEWQHSDHLWQSPWQTSMRPFASCVASQGVTTHSLLFMLSLVPSLLPTPIALHCRCHQGRGNFKKRPRLAEPISQFSLWFGRLIPTCQPDIRALIRTWWGYPAVQGLLCCGSCGPCTRRERAGDWPRAKKAWWRDCLDGWTNRVYTSVCLRPGAAFDEDACDGSHTPRFSNMHL